MLAARVDREAGARGVVELGADGAAALQQRGGEARAREEGIALLYRAQGVAGSAHVHERGAQVQVRGRRERGSEVDADSVGAEVLDGPLPEFQVGAHTPAR